jgi:hypothetical protein
MLIGRKTIYAMILSGYYTFTIIFSLGANYTDVLISTLIITVMSYVWLLLSVARFGTMMFDYTDLIINIFIYSFISFSVAFSTIIFSPYAFDWIGIALLLSPVIIWVIIWTDFYFQRIKGKI